MNLKLFVQRLEQIRRSRVIRTRLFIRIYMNGKLVHTTADAQMQSDFTVRWAQIFNIYVLASTLETDSIMLELYEHTGMGRAGNGNEHLVAEICLPTPDPANTSYSLDDYQFSSPNGNTSYLLILAIF